MLIWNFAADSEFSRASAAVIKARGDYIEDDYTGCPVETWVIYGARQTKAVCLCVVVTAKPSVSNHQGSDVSAMHCGCYTA